MWLKYSLIRQARQLNNIQKCMFKVGSLRSLPVKRMSPTLCHIKIQPSIRYFHHTAVPCADHTPPTEEILTQLSDVEYSDISDETLESLTEKFDELADGDLTSDEFDVQYSSGVLTVKLGQGLGTYVINKQSPNKQIWLSSPTSGPKRYDFVDGQWIYKHDLRVLHDLLTEEISAAYKQTIDFTACSYAGKNKS